METTCLGFTQQGKRCRNPVSGEDYCNRHLYQKNCQDLHNVDGLTENQIANIIKRGTTKRLDQLKKITRPRIKKVTPVKRNLPILPATPIGKNLEITDMLKLLSPQDRVDAILKEFAIDFQGKEEVEENPNYSLMFEYEQLEQQRRDLEKQKEELFAHEDRLARWEANLRKKEASLKEKEDVLNLLMAEDPAPIEQKFEEMATAVDAFSAMMKRLRGYRESIVTECCVCYNHHLAKEELLACGHPVCPNCRNQLLQAECPMCRRPLTEVPLIEQYD